MIVYDAVEVSAIPADAQIVLAYIDGNWPTYSQIKTRFPHATILTVTTNGFNTADICDVESGDATPAIASAGVKHGLYDTVYCARSNLGPLVTAMSDLPWHWFAADWTGVQHLVPGSVATQWAAPGFGSPGNYDISVTNGVWPHPPVPPAPPQPTVNLDPYLELVMSLASSDADALNFLIRDRWATYRSDPITMPAFHYLQEMYAGAWGKSLDLVLACIIDTAKTSGTLRPQFAGAV